MVLDHKRYSDDLNFRDILKGLKTSLSKDLSQKIKSLYISDTKYKEKLEIWMKEINWDKEWNWIKIIEKQDRNKYFRRKIEDILVQKRVYNYWRSCNKHDSLQSNCTNCIHIARPLISNDWLNRYKNQTNSENISFKQRIDKSLRDNGISIDNYDRLGLQGAYTLINRFLLLRIYEKNTEKSILNEEFILQVEKLSSPKAIFHLIQSVFEELAPIFEKIYFSPLFNDNYLEDVTIDKEIILEVIRKLSIPRLNDIDLIGTFYEDNLDRDIRNALGLFYTPQEVIKFMINRLPISSYIDDLEYGKLPLILDPSCGSGGFLVSCYNVLKDQLLQRKWKRKRIFSILFSNLIGLDIDNFAVQLSIMNLLIKEKLTKDFDFNVGVFTVDAVRIPIGLGQKQQRTLSEIIPSLKTEVENNKIQVEEFNKVNFRKKRFRFIIGNPPFFEFPRFSGLANLYPMIANDSKINIASLFLLRYSQLLEKKGILSFIFPASILFSTAFVNVRKYILEKFTILEIVQLGRAFSEVGLEQIVITIQKKDHNDNHNINVIYNIKSLDNESYEENKVLQKYSNLDRTKRFRIFLDSQVENIITKIESNSAFLIDHAAKYRVRNQNKIAIFRGLGLERELRTSRVANHSLPAIKGTNIMRFGIKDYYYLPNSRRKDTSSKYQLIKNESKILIQRLVSSKTRLVTTKETTGLAVISTIEVVILAKNAPWNIDFVVGILNSDLISYYVIDHIFMHSRLTTSLDKDYAGYLPIPLANHSIQRSIIQIVNDFEKIVQEGVNRGLSVDEIEESKSYLEKVETLNQQVYATYQLDEKEISIIKTRLLNFYNETGSKKV
ncbi:MAG: N-6 DNA methylase [Candidatus Hodarchaeales archaeon]|jgi:type I restriction-modification system DNA methylase subunit